jgi:hypothetical protein
MEIEMSIIRSEPDPRDHDENAMDEDIKNAKAELNNSVGDIREVMETVLENMTDRLLVMSRKDKEAFSEEYLVLLEEEYDKRAVEQANFRRG